MSILKANRIENLTTTDGGINVDNSGRVLIGTTSAGSNGTADDLIVANDGSASDQAGITIRGGTSGRSQIFFSDGTSGDAEYRGMLRYDHSEESMQLRTAASERLRIDSSGNVGIGLTSPTEFVDIRKDQNAFTWAQIQNQNSSSGAYAGIQFGAHGNTWGLANGSSAANSNSLVFVLDAGGSNSEKMRIDSSGRLLVGASATAGSARLIQIAATSSEAGLSATRYVNDAGGAAAIDLAKSRNGSIGSQTIVQSGDALGYLQFRGSDGTNQLAAAHIKTEVDGTPGTNDMPGRMIFSTSADGASSPTERMRIDSSGNVGIGATSINNSYGTNVNIHTTTTNGARLKISDGTSGNGNVDGLDLIHQSGVAYIIQRENNSMRFSTNNTERMRIHAGGTVSVPVGIELGSGVDGTSANTLEDYEEGTFTPAFSFSNLSVSSYHTQQGSYIKVGHIVHVSVYVRFSGSNLSGTPSTGGAVYINLPFVAGTKYSDTQYLGEPAAIGRLAEFRGSNDSTDFDRIFHYIGNSSSSMYFAVNKQPASPQSTDFLYGMSEKSFNGLIGVANNFEYRHSFTYESSS